MTVLTLDANGQECPLKGSADVLLPLCSFYATPTGALLLDDAKRASILSEDREAQ